MSEAPYQNVRLSRGAYRMIETRLKPGEDMSDGIERIITNHDELTGCLRATLQALGIVLPPKRPRTENKLEVSG